MAGLGRNHLVLFVLARLVSIWCKPRAARPVVVEKRGCGGGGGGGGSAKGEGDGGGGGGRGGRRESS